MRKRIVRVVTNRLREMRNSVELNQSQIAAYLGMSQTGYSKYETGENDIPTAVLIKLSDYYNTSVDYLLGLTTVVEAYPRINVRPKWDNEEPI